MFGSSNSDYSFKTCRVSMPSSLTTPSTCFTSRYFSSSTSSYRTPFSRYDRSNSTPQRFSEPVGHYYNRCVSEFSQGNRYHRENLSRYQDSSSYRPQSYSSSLSEIRKEKYNSMSSTTKAYSSDAYQSPTATLKNISSHRSSFPQYSDHVARYYQRISDIFETNESDQTSDKFNVVKRRQSVLKSKESVPVKTTYKTVLEDVKDLEQKYRRMNEDEERRRPRTDLDHYRPDVVLHNTKTPHQFKKLSSQETEQGIRGSSYDKLYSRTLKLYRDAATPPSPSSNKNMSTSKTSSSSITITPARYLAANLKTDLYSHRQSSKTTSTSSSLLEKSSHDKALQDRDDPGLNVSCGLKRRYTNRENRLARQLLEHIKTEQKWTSNVDRPFVLGI